MAWLLVALAALSAEGLSRPPTPVTLLSGFLGAGKTSTLSHLLAHADGLRLGVVVNDVAALNIDAQMVASQHTEDVVKLQNGCACCSIADELTEALARLGAAAQYDHIIVELSGVAEPDLVRANFRAALRQDPQLGVRLQRVVSLVDSSTFLSYFDTAAPVGQRSQLRELNAEGAPVDQCADQKVISQLLVGQVDAADVLVMNKRDLVSETELELVRKLLSSLNPKARLEVCERGVIGVRALLSPDGEEAHTERCDDSLCMDPSHDHSHHSDDGECTDPSHEHSHAHHQEIAQGSSHSHTAEHSHDGQACSDPGCTDPTHAHLHSGDTCTDPGCTDPTHDHSHAPSGRATSAVDKFGIYSFVYTARRPFDADRLAALLHQWPLDRQSPLESARIELGISQEKESGTPQAYSTGAPASAAPLGAPPLRFAVGERVQCNVGAWKGGRVTQHWYSEDAFDGAAPYQVLLDDGTYIFAPVDSDQCIRAEPEGAAESSPFRGVLRSKGWCWLSARPSVAGFWSHAGKHVEVTNAGSWWAALGDKAMREQLNPDDYEATLDDFEGDWGDCRQDIVFIGTAAMKEDRIRNALEGCLVSDTEMAEFRRAWDEEAELMASGEAWSASPRGRAPVPRMTAEKKDTKGSPPGEHAWEKAQRVRGGARPSVRGVRRGFTSRPAVHESRKT